MLKDMAIGNIAQEHAIENESVFPLLRRHHETKRRVHVNK